MKNFTFIVTENWPKRAIRVTAGNIGIYIGKNCKGLEMLKPEVIEYLDSHKIIHCWYSANEIEIVYKESKKLHTLIFGE